MRTPAELGVLMPGLLEVLAHLNVGVLVVVDRGEGHELERWYANEPSASILGYTLEELANVRPVDTVIPEQRPVVRNLITGFRHGHPVPPALELTGLHKDGRQIPIEIAIGSARAEGMAMYILVMRDVGLQSSQLSLLEADRISLVGALAAGFAHEINNPLTSVLLNLRSLRKQLHANLPEPVQATALRCLEDVTTGAERIASNVRALQTLVTRSGTQEIDLATVVASSLRLAAPTLEPCARVIRQIYPVRPVLGEESRIGQAVLAMLLFSSSGFDPESTVTTNVITVSVGERRDMIVVEVSDNGRDLTRDEARRAFDPFFRSHVRGAGVGVGLGVARSVAAAMGGEVSLAPRVGGGAVITMQLPPHAS
ncbi:MAG TPA: ATP-binding protein [Kofleriaceae bacterium]|nr:ATP-binding protein [Kofleriaceae bacterium]